MDIKVAKEQHHLVISLEGRIDSSVAKEFEDTVLKVIEDSANVIFNFSKLDYISSAGLRVILMAAKRLKNTSGTLQLCAMKPHIHDVFEVSGFLTMLDIKPTLQEALSQ